MKRNMKKWLAQTVRTSYSLLATHTHLLFHQATGLRDLHKIGIIHRDMKLENVLINWNMDAHITDVGLAYVDSKCEPLLYTKSYCHHHCGTTVYMAPEVQAVITEFDRVDRKLWAYCDPE